MRGLLHHGLAFKGAKQTGGGDAGRRPYANEIKVLK